MSNSDGGNSCKTICWVISALIGLLVFFWVKGSTGFFAALLIGLALAVILGLVLPQLFCSRADDTHALPESSPRSSAAEKDPPTATSASATASANGAEADNKDEAPAGAASSEDKGAAATPDFDGDGVMEGTREDTQPEALSGPLDGQADDLKQIKGVGPKLEKQLNSLGFYHFRQIASWSADEVAWVDANLQGFNGRVSRDNWVEQAKTLASGEQTEFSKRVEDGDVY